MVYCSNSLFPQPEQRTGGLSAVEQGGFRLFNRKLAISIVPALALWFGIFQNNPLLAQVDTSPLWVTNVAQLHQLVAQQWQVRCDLALTGTVCSASVARGVMVLADDTGAEMFLLDFAGQDVRAGQKVALTGNHCEALRRRTEIALRRAPLVDNDGVHAAVEKSGTVELATGRHPLRVEWFNAGGAAILDVSVAAPGRPRGPLSMESALAFRCIEGELKSLPDFDLYPAVKSGLATNFDVKLTPRNDEVALEFTGVFTAPSNGNYTFFLNSDDGARLYVGEALPRVEVLGEGQLPDLRRRLIGQVIGDPDIYR